MSGGSYDYAYGRVNDFADAMRADTPARIAFRAHLHDVADAMHAIEWVDSADWAPGDEDDAIAKCVSDADVHAGTTAGLVALRDALTAWLARGA
jgi:hypothetical protein